MILNFQKKARPFWGGLLLFGLILFGSGLNARVIDISDLTMTPKEDLGRIRVRYGLPALAAGVVSSKGLAWSEVLGLRSSDYKTAATSKDMFHLAACGRSLTIMLISRMVDEGTLNWEDNLGDLYASMPDFNASWSKVTLRQLAAHQGGAPGDLEVFHGGTLWQQSWKENDSAGAARWSFVQMLLGWKPPYRAESRVEPSPAGYILLGNIAELTAGKPFEVLLKEKILQPLGLKGCGLGAAGELTEKVPSQPWGHRLSHFKIESVAPSDPRADLPPLYSPAGRIHCNIDSLAALLRLQLRAIRGLDQTLLSKEAVQEMFSAASGGMTLGGWQSLKQDWADGPALRLAGSNGLHSAEIWMAPKKGLAYFVLTNVGGARAQKALSEAAQLLFFYGEKP